MKLEFEEIEKHAIQGQKMILDDAVDLLLYHALKSLYREYHEGKIDRNDGAKQKKEIKKAYDTAKARINDGTKYFAYHQDNIRRAGSSLSALEKSGGLDDALQAIAAMTGDYSLPNRILSKKYF